MPAPSNLSFETAGAGAGVALAWTLTAVATVDEWADYAGAADSTETLEAGWQNDAYLFSFGQPNLSAAQFGTVHVDTVKLVEDFSELWQGNESYLSEMPGQVQAASYASSSGPSVYDGFGTSWLPGGVFKTSFSLSGGDLSSAFTEAFTSWVPSYKTAFVGIGTDLANKTFANGVDTVDTFERVAFRVQVAPEGISPYYYLVVANGGGHTFQQGQGITFDGDQLPTGLSPGIVYYAHNVADTTKLQVTTTPGSVNPIAFTQTTTTPIYVQGLPAGFWVEKLTSI